MTARRAPQTRPVAPTTLIGAFALLASFGVLGAQPELAAAQTTPEESSAAETAAARSLAIEGMKLAQAGQCDQAVPKLERAEQLHHSPIVLGRLGECYIALGRLVEGTETLRKMLREPLPPQPSPAMQQAYTRAEAALAAAKPRVAALTITLDVPEGTTATVSVDGKPVPAAVLGADFPVDPGEHTVEVSAPGFLKQTSRVSVRPGEKHTVPVALRPDPNAPSPAAAPSSPAPPAVQTTPAPGPSRYTLDEPTTVEPDAPPPAPPNRTAAYACWAFGAVGLGVGIGFGLAAMSDKSDLDERCVDDRCPASSEDSLNLAKTKGNISTIGFGLGAVGAALGTVFYFTAGDDSPSRDTAKARSGPRATVGLGHVQLTTNF